MQMTADGATPAQKYPRVLPAAAHLMDSDGMHTVGFTTAHTALKSSIATTSANAMQLHISQLRSVDRST